MFRNMYSKVVTFLTINVHTVIDSLQKQMPVLLNFSQNGRLKINQAMVLLYYSARRFLGLMQLTAL